MEFLNTNISGEMAQYLMSVLSKYVPRLKKGSGNVVLDKVFLDGDQLTEECARNENVLVMFNGFFRMVMTDIDREVLTADQAI